MSPGFMLFEGQLCSTTDKANKIPQRYIYMDEQFNRHIFVFDEQRYNHYQNQNKRAYAFYSDTGWKGVCELEIASANNPGDPGSYNYVKDIRWVLYPPDGRQIELGLDVILAAGSNDGESLEKRTPVLLKQKESDRFGNWIAYEWMGAGEDADRNPPFQWLGLKQITTNDGRTLTFDWQGYHRAIDGDVYQPSRMDNYHVKITDGNNRLWDYTDSEAIMPDNRQWRYTFSRSMGTIISVTNPFGGKHTYEFKQSFYPFNWGGRLSYLIDKKSFTHADGSKSEWSYTFEENESKELFATVTDPVGNKTRYKHWSSRTAYADEENSFHEGGGLSCFRKGKLQSVEHLNANNQRQRFIYYAYNRDFRTLVPDSSFFNDRCDIHSGGFCLPGRNHHHRYQWPDLYHHLSLYLRYESSCLAGATPQQRSDGRPGY